MPKQTSFIKEFFTYGESVDGFSVKVLNEREARAAAGILFAIGLLSLTNAGMLGHGIVTRYFISFFTFDFFMRVLQPRYSPSLLLGRFFVQNQTPEYVGATQKRFAWTLGLLLALPMFYLLVINWQPTPIKVFICIICLLLLVFESAFSICLGCKIFNLILGKKATLCPGDVCEIKKKERIQTFNLVQKTIVSLTVIIMIFATYQYFYKLPNKSVFGNALSKMMLSQEEIEVQKEKKYQQAVADFENDDDF